MRDIAEKDWKYFRTLHKLAVNRFSKETLSNISKIIASKEIESKHEKYLEIYRYIHERNEMLRDYFDGLRRSTAKIQILGLCRLNLIKPEEFNLFSEDVKNFVNDLL